MQWMYELVHGPLGENDVVLLNPLLFADQVKEIQDIPVVLLLNNSSELQYLQAESLEKSQIDHTFVWNGNSLTGRLFFFANLRKLNF